MAQQFYGQIGFRGSNARTTVITYDLGVLTGADAGAEYLLAVAALGAIRTAVNAITAAQIYFSRVYANVTESAVIPVSEDARVYVNAVVSVHIGVTGEVPKYATIRVPAPVDGLFLGDEGSGEDEDIIDVTDAGLQAYVAALEANALVSDGETINLTLGTQGIHRGRRVSRDIPNPFA